MAKGPSGRELATAEGIIAGKSIAKAMIDAGYSPKHANANAGRVETRLRDLGLLPTPDDTRDVVAMLRRVVIEEDKGRALETMYRVALSQAQAGDDKARTFIMSYLAGKPSQPVAVTGAGGGPVETVTRVVFEWSDANDIPPDDTDAGDDDAD